MLALTFYNNKIDLSKFRFLYILPTIALVTLWTNSFTSLFYVKYSTIFVENVYGPMFIINAIYSYICLFLAVIILIRTSLKKSGFFSKQTGLIVLGCIAPLLVNMLGAIKIIRLDVYITPIMFTLTAICFAFSIIKYKALNITPIAFRTVIDTMSDAFIVISDDGTIVDNNLTFENTFKGILKTNKDENFFEMFESSKASDIKILKNHIDVTRRENKILKEEYHMVGRNFDKYFEVDIHPIKAKHSTEYVG
ncbi:MAG: histidine kinase N-terminal 7TM domain-containing protein, partial [Clostridia bacterium]|nr:histidine kinase N-terminal 7TM domain-containing protein [Clostridia bacterium]